MKRADFSNGFHPVCAASCQGSCGAPVNFGVHQDIPIFAMNSANAILTHLKNNVLLSQKRYYCGK